MVFDRGQAVVDGLLQSGADQDIADEFFLLDGPVVALWRQLIGQERDGDVVVAVDAGDLLEQISGDGAVQAIPGLRRPQRLVLPTCAELQALENTLDLGRAIGRDRAPAAPLLR